MPCVTIIGSSICDKRLDPIPARRRWSRSDAGPGDAYTRGTPRSFTRGQRRDDAPARTARPATADTQAGYAGEAEAVKDVGPLTELRDLAFAFKDIDKRFTHARRLLLRVRRHDDFKDLEFQKRRKILQQLALWTYKDDDLPAERRPDRALKWPKGDRRARTTGRFGRSSKPRASEP
jgi:hypothetical protein